MKIVSFIYEPAVIKTNLFHFLGKTDALCGTDPFQLQPFGADSHLAHFLADTVDALFGPVVGIDKVTVADMAAAECSSFTFTTLSIYDLDSLRKTTTLRIYRIMLPMNHCYVLREDSGQPAYDGGPVFPDFGKRQWIPPAT